MPKRLELTGKRFGKLLVSEFAYCKINSYRKCKCDCGNEIIVSSNNLMAGDTKSCGCLQKEMSSIKHKKHGFYKTRIYRIWRNINCRCTNKNAVVFKGYGGRGITICDRRLKFEGFHEDMYCSYLDHVKKFGEIDTTIERIDNNGNYCKENCKRATKKEQANNTRLVKKITHNGITLSYSGWSKSLNGPRNLVCVRLKKGRSVVDAITIPHKKRYLSRIKSGCD